MFCHWHLLTEVQLDELYSIKVNPFSYMYTYPLRWFHVIMDNILYVYFLLGHLLVQVTWWFLAFDSSEIQASVEDFRSIKTSPQTYANYFLVL